MTRRFLSGATGVALASLGLVAIGTSDLSLADERVPYTIEVENASAKVGERTTIRAVVTPPESFRITKSYRSRVIDLSAYENRGVRFEDEVVFGAIENGSAVFEVPVTPTEPGEHRINGLIRVSFNSDGRAESKSIPLIATVAGTE
jgi:hypothetical protein